MRLQRGQSIPAAQVRCSPAPAATRPSPPRSDHAARVMLGCSPRDHRAVAVRLGGAGTKRLPGGDRGLPASPPAGSPRTPSGSGPCAAGGRGAVGGGAQRRRGGHRAGGVPRVAQVGKTGTPPPCASFSPSPHYLACGLLVTVAAVNELPSRGGSAKAD